MNRLFYLVFILLSHLLFSLPAQAFITDGFWQPNPELLSYIKDNLQQTGILQQTEQGFVYVKVSNSNILDLLNKINNDNKYHAAFSSGKLGAHISVIERQENNKIKPIAEIGTVINFKPIGFYKIAKNNKEYYMLAIDAPELYKIRAKYGLSPKLGGDVFHIAVGVRDIIAEDELAP